MEKLSISLVVVFVSSMAYAITQIHTVSQKEKPIASSVNNQDLESIPAKQQIEDKIAEAKKTKHS